MSISVYCGLGQRHGQVCSGVKVCHVPSYIGFRRWRCRYCGEVLPQRSLLRELVAVVLRA